MYSLSSDRHFLLSSNPRALYCFRTSVVKPSRTAGWLSTAYLRISSVGISEVIIPFAHSLLEFEKRPS